MNKNGLPMKAEEWIGLIGVFLVLTVVMFALLRGDASWDDADHQQADIQINDVNAGRGTATTGPLNWVNPNAPTPPSTGRKLAPVAPNGLAPAQVPAAPAVQPVALLLPNGQPAPQPVPAAMTGSQINVPQIGGPSGSQMTPVARVQMPQTQGKAMLPDLPPQPNQRNKGVPSTRMAQPGMMPFERAPKVRFEGQVQQITEMPQRDGQIHIWLNMPAKGNQRAREQQISIAPGWFLRYMNCTITHDIQLSGIGFQFERKRPSALIYAQKITIGRKVCQLRNDEGFALWSNKLR